MSAINLPSLSVTKVVDMCTLPSICEKIIYFKRDNITFKMQVCVDMNTYAVQAFMYTFEGLSACLQPDVLELILVEFGLESPIST